MLFDKAVYKDQEYICRKITSKRIEIRSYVQTNADLCYFSRGGYWCKCVYISDCEEYRKFSGYAVYNGEKAEIYDVDANNKEIGVIAYSSWDYSDDFVNKVLKGQNGRDIYSKCDANLFHEFLISDCNTEEKNVISLEQLMKNMSLYNYGVLIWDLAEGGSFISASLK